MTKAITLSILVAALFCTASIDAQVSVLTHATVIDGTGAEPQKDVTIVIENGRIRDTGPSSKVSVPAGATVVDLKGKFVAPGIINAHGHVGAKTEPQLRQYALYGVTTVTSMQTDPDEVVQVREAQKRGESPRRKGLYREIPLRARSRGRDTAAGTGQSRPNRCDGRRLHQGVGGWRVRHSDEAQS